jgi:uncharacterized membrane protein YqgA involved in biofilm formation
MLGLGTVLDGFAIVAGSAAGVALGDRLPKRWCELMVSTLALFLMAMGISQSTQAFTGDFATAVGNAAAMVVLGSLLIGGALGVAVDVEVRLDRLGHALQRRFGGSGRGDFASAFVTTTLVVCVGPLAVLGAFTEGLQSNHDLLLVKSVLDLFVALAFASNLGWGVAFSAVPLVVYQGTLTGLASALQEVMVPSVIGAMTAVGGILILAVGLRLLELRDIAVANLLPALPLAPILTTVLLATQ